jgi:hypothetical protein
LIPTLRSRSSETDVLARLPDSTIADFEKAQLFDILVPKMYGGLQCSLRTFMDVVVELGRGDGSAAWTLALLSSGTWMAATLYPKHVVDEIFSGGNSRTASVLAPRKVKTRRVEGGVLIEDRGVLIVVSTMHTGTSWAFPSLTTPGNSSIEVPH